MALRGRTRINLNQHKDEIIDWFQNKNKTHEEIAQALNLSYDTKVTARTVRRRLKDWNITKRTRVQDTAELRARIAYMFCILGFTDSEMLYALKLKGY